MDWTQYDQLKAQGLADREIARQWGIVWSTLHREKQKREPTGVTVPENQGQNTEVHYSTPTSRQRHTQLHPSTPNLAAKRSTTVYHSTPVAQSTQDTRVYHGRMMRPCACCLCFLTWSYRCAGARSAAAPQYTNSTPRNTVEKTYVVDTLYVDLIDRYAQAEGVELKDVVNLAFHEFFERRKYLPSEG
jgi:hypothetical protein